MKKSILFLSTIFIVSAVLFSCSDDDTNNVKDTEELKLASQEVSLMVGENKTIKILTGNDSYTVKASNTNIKTSVEKGIITIEGLASGDALVTVTDSKKKEAKIKVTVTDKTAATADLTLDMTNIELVKGKKANIEITGGSGTYTVESDDPAIATVELKGTSIEVMANETGTAKITVTDTEFNKTKEVAVEVTYVTNVMLELDKTELTIVQGATGTVTITSGTGTYTVESLDKNKATAEVDNDTNLINIKGDQIGKTTVTVTDSNSGKTQDITVVVEELKPIGFELYKEGKKLAPYKTDPSGPYFLVFKDDIITIKITGGTGINQFIPDGAVGTSKYEFLGLTEVLGGKEVIKDNSFQVKILETIKSNNGKAYFQIEDSGSNLSKFISFES